MRRANWDDLNYLARMATLAAAGLPMIQPTNDGAIVATQSLCRQLGAGPFSDDFDALAAHLPRRHDAHATQQLREQVWSQRHLFTFDHHAPTLVGFFRTVIAARQR